MDGWVKAEGGRGGLRILKKQQMTFSQSFISSPPPPHPSTPHSIPLPCHLLLLFPLTHPLMVIYLVGKGFAFSPERWTTRTGREQKKPSRLANKKKEKEEEKERAGGLPGDTDSLFLSLFPSHSPSQL